MLTFKNYLNEQSKPQTLIGQEPTTPTGAPLFPKIKPPDAPIKTKDDKEKKDNLERTTVSNSLKHQARFLGPGESWNDSNMTTVRHDLAMTLGTGFIPHGAPGSYGTPKKQMEVEKNWGTDVGLAFDVGDDDQLVADQAGMKALQNRRKQGKSVFFKKETPAEVVGKIFSGKGIESPFD